MSGCHCSCANLGETRPECACYCHTPEFVALLADMRRATDAEVSQEVERIMQAGNARKLR